MKKFAELLESLIYSPSTNKKIYLLERYFKSNNTLENGYAVSVLSSNYKMKFIRVSEIKSLMHSKFDKTLFELSYDYVGDLAETISLFWKSNICIANSKKLPLLSEFIKNCENKPKNKMYDYLFNLLDISNPTQRWAIIKILSGGLRIGVSEKTVKKALSKYGNKELEKIEKIWHGLNHPYNNLFDWLDNKKPEPIIDNFKTFHPMMLSNPIDEKKDFQILDHKDFVAEWKWDGIRVQIIISNDKVVLFSRNGDDITKSFPDITFFSKKNVVIDGELLVGKNCQPSSFNDLQQRLNRKKVSEKIIDEFPAFIKAYDILFLGKRDLRNLNFLDRRKVLEEWIKINGNEKIDLSKFIKFNGWPNLQNLKTEFTKTTEIYEGIMLKNKESIYESGRPRGKWFKWKRNPKYIDAILMYAQRGHGKRSSFYSDYTFGIWNEDKIVPIGKAYSGFTDKELNMLDRFVRSNTINRFGPVREIKKEIVFEIAFDSISESKRHKSGIALRFPRISRIRWDKPIDDVEDLKKIKKDFNIS